MNHMRKLLLVVTVLVAATWGVQAGGLKIVTENKSPNGKVDQTQTLYLGENKLKMASDEASMIYDDQSKDMIQIDHKKKEYMVLTKEDMEYMKQQMQKARERLKNLPPSQREMMKKMMGKKMMGGAPEVPLEYKKTSETATINGWNTTLYEGYREEEKEEQAWVAEPSEVDLHESDFAVIKSFADYVKSLMKGFVQMDMDKNIYKSAGQYDGFPVKSVHMKNGKPQVITEVKSIDRVSLSADTFEVPEGYKEQEVNMGR